MRQAKRVLAIAALALVTSCSTQTIPAGTPPPTITALRLYGTTATIPLLQDLTSAYMRANPQIVFDTFAGSYSSMIERVLSLETPYLLSNHLPSDSPLWAAPIGQDGVAVIVHPDTGISNLTLNQLREIYQGRVLRWSELGGSDVPITVLTREAGSGTRAEFESQVLGERITTPSARIIPTSPMMVSAIASTSGGIGYVSMGYLDSGVRAVTIEGVALTRDNVANNLYPLRSTLYVVGLEEPVNDFRAFIGWIQSPAGQRVVSQHYAPMSP